MRSCVASVARLPRAADRGAARRGAGGVPALDALELSGVEGVSVLRPALLGTGATAELITRRPARFPIRASSRTATPRRVATRCSSASFSHRARGTASEHRARAHRSARASRRSSCPCCLGARRRLRAAAREPARRARPDAAITALASLVGHGVLADGSRSRSRTRSCARRSTSRCRHRCAPPSTVVQR